MDRFQLRPGGLQEGSLCLLAGYDGYAHHDVWLGDSEGANWELQRFTHRRESSYDVFEYRAPWTPRHALPAAADSTGRIKIYGGKLQEEALEGTSAGKYQPANQQDGINRLASSMHLQSFGSRLPFNVSDAMAMDEDWKFRQLLEDLRSLHENALSAMREEIKQLRTDGEVSNDFTPSVELLPKALGPQLESSTPLPELVVDIDVPPMPELQDWIGDAPEVEVSVYPPKESDDEPIASRRASRKGTDEMAREAARAMLLVPMPPPSKSEEDANEAPTQRDSSKSIGKSRSSGASKKSTPKDAAVKSDEASRFAAAKEVIEAKSALDLSAELPSDAKLAKYLVSDRYELILGLVVLSSVAILAADFQFTGYVIGQEIGFKDMKSLPAGEEDPGWLQVLTLSMDIFFGLEVAFRVIVLRFVFFKIWVNWLDFVVVYLSLAVDIIGGMNAGFNVGVVRLLRLAKIARALRVVRMRRALESLSLLLRCVQSSLQVLFWSLGLLGVIQCIAGMVIGQLLVPYMRDMTLEAEGRHEVYKYFGTFSRTFLTMFEVLFANWAIPARICGRRFYLHLHFLSLSCGLRCLERCFSSVCAANHEGSPARSRVYDESETEAS
eukprot:symbB.v1.2.015483.t1/scaffold1083.1/size139395/2